MGKQKLNQEPKEPQDDQGSKSPGEPGYTKQQFLGSAKYADKKDVLHALLVDNKTYSIEEVDRLLDTFLKQEAK